MRITNFFNVTRENLPGSEDWVEGLLSPLNSTLFSTYTALNQNLSIGDNLIGQTSRIQVVTASTYTSGVFTALLVPWQFPEKARPNHLIVSNVTQGSNQPPILNTVQVPSWTYNFDSRSISIPYVTGLANSSTYTLTLLIL